MSKVASHLAGKPVKVRFQHNEGFYGLCRADSSGVPVIDLEPQLQFYEEKFLRVFLHEVSHSKTDTFIPMELEVSDRVEQVQNKVYNTREAQADKQAETWLKFAETNRSNEFNYLEGCLWTLLTL